MGMEFQAFFTAVLAADKWSAVHIDILTLKQCAHTPTAQEAGWVPQPV